MNGLVLGPGPSLDELRQSLDGFLAGADRPGLAANDPVGLVHPYADPADQEVAGLLVAMLAYGRVASIRARAQAALSALGPHPSRTIADPEARQTLAGFVYRFQRGQDLPRFLGAIAQLLSEHGSLGAAFLAGDPGGADYARAMGAFAASLRRAAGRRLSYGLRFLIPDAEKGGAAKRLCLYLRWMIRPQDGVDLGTWSALGLAVEPGRLVIPLDTHIHRIGRYLGLTERASPNLETAKEITRALAQLAPQDPLRYDLALCHLGISGRCPKRRDPVKCEGCPIRAVCRLGDEPPDWPFGA